MSKINNERVIIRSFSDDNIASMFKTPGVMVDSTLIVFDVEFTGFKLNKINHKTLIHCPKHEKSPRNQECEKVAFVDVDSNGYRYMSCSSCGIHEAIIVKISPEGRVLGEENERNDENWADDNLSSDTNQRYVDDDEEPQITLIFTNNAETRYLMFDSHDIVFSNTFEVTKHNGEIIKLGDIKKKTYVFCPKHEIDLEFRSHTASAFVGIDKKGRHFVHCSKCGGAGMSIQETWQVQHNAKNRITIEEKHDTEEEYVPETPPVEPKFSNVIDLTESDIEDLTESDDAKNGCQHGLSNVVTKPHKKRSRSESDDEAVLVVERVVKKQRVSEEDDKSTKCWSMPKWFCYFFHVLITIIH